MCSAFLRVVDAIWVFLCLKRDFWCGVLVSDGLSLVDGVLAFLGGVPGVRRVRVLGDVERVSLLRCELEGEEGVVFGCRVFNEGLREALSREVVVACSTDMGFVWPRGPHVVLRLGEVVVGFITDDVEGVRSEFGEEVRVFGGNLVIFPERVRRLRGGKVGATLFVSRGFKMEELERRVGVRNVVLAFCNRAGDAYLKGLLGEENKPELGSIVIGFDIS